MSVVEVRTFLDIQDAILRRGKIEDTTDNRTAIKEYINTKYQQVCREEFYRWSGVTAPILLRGKYTTGTITATNGSDEITGASTVWSENSHRLLKMRISGCNTVFKILRVGSSTTITLDQPFIGTTASLLSYIIYKDEYGLFPDFQGIRKVRIPGISSRFQPKPTGIENIDQMRDRSPFREGLPMFYTVFGNAVYTEKTWATFNIDTDYWEDTLDTQPRNQALTVWPGIMTTDKPALVRYTKIPYALGSDSEEPIIPYWDRSVLVWGVLSDRFLTNRDIPTRNEWKKEYEMAKKKMAGDIETTDDELILMIDRRRFSRGRRFIFDEDEIADL